MSLRETLLARTDVTNEDIEQIMERAQKMQEEAHQKERSLSSDDVKDIASELQIDPRFVDAAIEQLRESRKAQREADAQKAKEQEAQRQERAVLQRKLIIGGVVAVVVIVVLLFLVGLSGKGDVTNAHLQASQARGRLETVLDKQANLAPQLLGLSGGDPTTISPLAETLRQEKDLDKKLADFQALTTAVSASLAKLPPATTTEATQQRQELRFQLEGAQNRITTEQQRYKNAYSSWSSASQSFSGSLAITFGLAPGEAP